MDLEQGNLKKETPVKSQALRLSIVIASYNSKNTIAGCLRSLEDQISDGSAEIVVVDSSTDGTGELVKSGFPKVKLFEFKERKFPGDARNFGVSMAKGEIIAFIDADCMAEKSWVEHILNAQQGEIPVVGGAISNGNPESHVGWATYFCEFGGWMPHLPKGFINEIPTCCLSLRRWVFDRYGPFLEGTYCSDTAFHWRLEKEGIQVQFDPTITVFHFNITDLWAFLKKELFHGRSFARVRIHVQDFSIFRRVGYALASPLIPFLLFFRRAGLVFGRGGPSVRFLRSSPLVFIGLVSWSVGEFLGYVSPPKKKHGS